MTRNPIFPRLTILWTILRKVPATYALVSDQLEAAEDFRTICVSAVSRFTILHFV
jgi:hypothetical protein